MERWHSLLTVKALDAERREITGIATTPTPDRVGDVIEPRGVKFANPLPLLLFHDHRRPVGTVKFDRPTDDGITFTAKLPSIDDPGALRERVEEAWQSVKAGLIKGVSIGFRVLDDGIELLRSGGVRFTKTEVLELSLVVVPANAEAVISTIKSIDADHLAASGRGAGQPERDTSGATDITSTAAPTRAVKATKGAGTMKKTITERKADLTAEKSAKVAKMTELMAGEDGSTLDASQQDEFDTLTAEVKSMDGHLARLETIEKLNVQAAVEPQGKGIEEASVSRGGDPAPVVTIRPNQAPGIGFARVVLCKAAAFSALQRGEYVSALDIARKRYPDDSRVQHYLKTAVAAGTTTDTTWAAPLLADAQVLPGEFLEFLRARTILGQFGTTVNGVAIPSLRRVPFNIRIQAQSVGGSSGWVGQGKPKAVTKFGYTDVTLTFMKVAAITVITEELARFSVPNAETLVRDQLAEVVIARMDSDFIDPAISETSNVRPASITNGLTAQTSAGTSAANVLTDIQNLIEPFILAKVPIMNVVLIMPETLALVLSLMQNSLGQREFPEMSVSGGRLRGFPVITSQYAANESSYGNLVIAVNARDIALADDGQVTVDASREASIQMDDTPTNDASTGTGQSLVSMFQTNSIALRAERVVTWKKLRDNAVVYMDDVNWGSIGSPV